MMPGFPCFFSVRHVFSSRSFLVELSCTSQILQILHGGYEASHERAVQQMGAWIYQIWIVVRFFSVDGEIILKWLGYFSEEDRRELFLRLEIRLQVSSSRAPDLGGRKGGIRLVDPRNV